MGALPACILSVGEEIWCQGCSEPITPYSILAAPAATEVPVMGDQRIRKTRTYPWPRAPTDISPLSAISATQRFRWLMTSPLILRCGADPNRSCT